MSRPILQVCICVVLPLDWKSNRTSLLQAASRVCGPRETDREVCRATGERGSFAWRSDVVPVYLTCPASFFWADNYCITIFTTSYERHVCRMPTADWCVEPSLSHCPGECLPPLPWQHEGPVHRRRDPAKNRKDPNARRTPTDRLLNPPHANTTTYKTQREFVLRFRGTIFSWQNQPQ